MLNQKEKVPREVAYKTDSKSNEESENKNEDIMPASLGGADVLQITSNVRDNLAE